MENKNRLNKMVLLSIMICVCLVVVLIQQLNNEATTSTTEPSPSSIDPSDSALIQFPHSVVGDLLNPILVTEYGIEVQHVTEDSVFLFNLSSDKLSYSGEISPGEYITLNRNQVGDRYEMPSDEDIRSIEERLLATLNTSAVDDVLIDRGKYGVDVFYYLEFLQNGSIHLTYDMYGLRTAQIRWGETMRPAGYMDDELGLSELGKVGLLYGSFDEIDEKIYDALIDGGLTFICDVDFPELPLRVQKYRVAGGHILDCDFIMNALFGDECEYELQSDAFGYHFDVDTKEGYYMGVYHEDSFYNAIRMSVYTGGEKLTEERILNLIQMLLEFPGYDFFSNDFEKSFDISANCAQITITMKIDTIPVSFHAYTTGNREERITGPYILIKYDANGLVGLKVRPPVSVESTGEEITGLISSSEAYQIVQNSMSSANVNAVQVIREIRFAYLSPGKTGEELIPVWEITYDHYTFGTTKDQVKASLGEYRYLIHAQTGKVITFH